ncbi:MAG: NAD-dependent epimerase/dehydratase family protein [Frankia sp.]
MRVAVTGGSGFIGAHVVDKLLDAGHDVLSLDLDARMPDPRASYRVLDVLDLGAVTDALVDREIVYHIAGMANVDFAFKDPAKTVRLNVEGTGNILEAARIHQLKRVVFASTVWVYGAVDDPAPAADGSEPALTEDAQVNLAKAGHIYTSTKVAAELLLHSYRETYGVPFTILRYGIPYGPGMRDELVLARFVKKALDGEALTVAGDGQQFRNYVFVRDLAEAHVLALGETAENATIALEGSERVSVLDMAQRVKDHFPGTRIEHVPARPGDYRGREISNELAAELLGWRPTTVFRDGVAQYVDWYLGNKDVHVPRVTVPPAAQEAAGGEAAVPATSAE